MNKTLLTLLALATTMVVEAGNITLTVNKTRKQTITGFGAACCDGAMKPYGTDTNPVKLLYGPTSKIGLNIMRAEISPSHNGDDGASWGNTYNWQGGVPSAKIVKQRGGIVFATPWSPPGDFKTNGTAQGGNSDDQGNVKGKLREDCYPKFFPWLNDYLKYMKSKGVQVDAVSIQNEPDWWVSYSGCLYEPQELVTLVKNYAHLLDRETYNGVKLISGESLGFTQNYTDPLMKDTTCRKHIDIVAGHLYGHAPLEYMKQSAILPAKYGKEVWMTEHSVTDNVDRLPNWHEQLLFAEELNECMLSGCTGYIYWYMRAHWAFVSTGEAKYGAANKTKNKLLRRAYVMSHFSKHVTGSTRLGTMSSIGVKTNAAFETSAYIKGDSLIVMAIDTTQYAHDLKLKLPYAVESGVHLLSTEQQDRELLPIDIAEPTKEIVVSLPARSLNTYIFKLDKGALAISDQRSTFNVQRSTYYDLHGRRLDHPHGLVIERTSEGQTRKLLYP